MQNIGDKPTKFLLRTQAPFSTSIKDGYLDVHGAVQVTRARGSVLVELLQFRVVCV